MMIMMITSISDRISASQYLSRLSGLWCTFLLKNFLRVLAII